MANIETIQYLSQDELKQLLRVITARRDRAIFLLAYRHGLRASEVGLIQLPDLDLARGRIRIHRLKGSQGGEYMLQPDELRILKAWLKERAGPGPCLFPSQKGGPISRRQLDYLTKKYGSQANIPPGKRHFHVLKHSIATHLHDAGADPRFIQYWLGHKNIQNVIIYEHLSPQARESGARVLNSPFIVWA